MKIIKSKYLASRFHFTKYPVSSRKGFLSIGSFEIDCEYHEDVLVQAFGILGGPIIKGVKALKEYEFLRTKNYRGGVELLIKYKDKLVMRIYNPEDNYFRGCGNEIHDGIFIGKGNITSILENLLEEIGINLFVEKGNSRDNSGKRG